MRFEDVRFRARRRMGGLLAALAVQGALLLALLAAHPHASRPAREVFLQLVNAAPPPRPPAPRPDPPRKPTRPRAPARDTHAPTPATVTAPTRTTTPTDPTPPVEAPAGTPSDATPIAPLDLSAATIHRAIAKAAPDPASASLATRLTPPALSPAEQRVQALAEAERQGCLTPEDKRKPSRSGIKLGGLLAIPGLIYDAATGKCSMK